MHGEGGDACYHWNRNFADLKRYLELHRTAGLQTMAALTAEVSFRKSYLPLVGLLDVVSTHPGNKSREILEATRNGSPTLGLYNEGMDRFTFGYYPWVVGAKGRWE